MLFCIIEGFICRFDFLAHIEKVRLPSVTAGRTRLPIFQRKYALYGVSNGIASFGGEPTTFLGWYANKEQISKEVLEIQNTIVSGIATYTLKYSVKTQRRWMGIKIVEE